LRKILLSLLSQVCFFFIFLWRRKLLECRTHQIVQVQKMLLKFLNN
jgi:hypothetical protein